MRSEQGTTPSHVTVDEAALRLHVSVATVRRRLKAGNLTGYKLGRDWQVDETSLPPPSRGPLDRSSAFTRDELLLANKHLVTDLTELWVPDVLRWRDAQSDLDLLLRRIEVRLSLDLPTPGTDLRIPKSLHASRPGMMIDFVERVIYQAAVRRIAVKIDGTLSDRVFSSRLSSDPRYFLKKSVDQWVLWRRSYIDRLQERGGLVVLTDLTGYFETIDQPTLLKELEELTGEGYALDVIRKQIKAWSVLLHRGLPQGPNASRVLGNAYLIPVDQVMLEQGYDYYRYMDDVAVVVKDQAEVARVVADFERSCHDRGLLVNTPKTSVITLSRAIAEADNARKEHAAYLMTSHSARATEALMEIFRDAMPAHGPIDVSNAKFSLWRLTQQLSRSPLNRLLSRIHELGPIASISAAYLRKFLTQPRTEAAITKFLYDADRNTSDYFESWVFAAALEHPGVLPERWVARARAIATDRNRANFHRVLAFNLLALGEKASDVAFLKRCAIDDHDPELVRGAIVALARVSKLDRVTTAGVEARHAEIGATIVYLRGRGALPSLVYRGRSVAVRQ